ncbi:putative receptor-like protein 8 [Papaver somniferum]|uniref:putative receptor-like protein 8 n=1 Tax=Papaver somniferum TaxID=3469 RepID=UPI000E704DF5|nr:putative receptor-like protein 8 [Papaver somniferum]
MIGLESLDLSFNKLSGSIPESLKALDSLGHLNLSYNNSSGRIPRGHHFETLSVDGSAFFGNDLLCGVPTNKSCEGSNTSADITDEEHPREMLLFYGIVAMGFAVGFGGLFFVLLLKKEKWWFGYWRVVDTIAAKVTGCIMRNR